MGLSRILIGGAVALLPLLSSAQGFATLAPSIDEHDEHTSSSNIMEKQASSTSNGVVGSGGCQVSVKCHCGAVDIPNIPLHESLQVRQKDEDGTSTKDNLLVCSCDCCRKSASAAFGAYVRTAAAAAAAAAALDTPAFLAREQHPHIVGQKDVCSHLGPVVRYRCSECHSSLGLRQLGASNDDREQESACSSCSRSFNSTTATTWLAMGSVKDESIPKYLVDMWHEWDSSATTSSSKHVTVACQDERAAWIDARPLMGEAASSQHHHHRRQVRGGCNCGSCRYEIDTLFPHTEFQHCHCNLCRRMSGSAFMTWVPARSKEFKWTKTDGLVLMRTTHHGQRHACKKCGSVLTIVYDTQPHLVWPAAGSFDDLDLGSTADINERTHRVAHICCAWKSPWYHLPDDSYPRVEYAA